MGQVVGILSFLAPIDSWQRMERGITNDRGLIEILFNNVTVLASQVLVHRFQDNHSS